MDIQSGLPLLKGKNTQIPDPCVSSMLDFGQDGLVVNIALVRISPIFSYHDPCAMVWCSALYILW